MSGFGGAFGLGNLPTITDGVDGYGAAPSNSSLSSPGAGSRVAGWFSNFAGGLLRTASETAGQAATIVSTNWLDRLAARTGINPPGTPTEARIDESPPGNVSARPTSFMGGSVPVEYVIAGGAALVGIVMLARR